MKLLILLSCISLVCCKEISFDFFDQEPPIVKTRLGAVRGSWEESTNERPYAAFEGIPYAKPPIGALRFQAPEPLEEPWTEILNASGAQENCVQYDPFFQQVSGSEDCLFVNVYSPQLNPSAGLPVVVFVHSGAYMYGAGFHFEPVHLMDWDMVVVTFNYRLGALGFLSTGDKLAPGNAGLKDQALVLHWVKKNIKAFGGDPNNVILTGNSCGAASVHYLYLSPLAEGTFSKGIAWSGSAFAPWAYMTKPLKKAKQLATLLDCPTTTNQEMVTCLLNINGTDIVNATTKMFDWKFYMFSPFVPTTESPEVEGAFLTRHPYEATKLGSMYNAPLIVSVTSDEGLYPAAAYYKEANETLPELENHWEELAHEVFEYKDTLPVNQRWQVATKIKKQYFGEEPLFEDTFNNLVQAMGDRNFVSGAGKLAEYHAAKSSQPVYMYRYSFQGERSFTFAFLWDFKKLGVSHADDIFHIFPAPFVSSSSTEDMKMTEGLINMIYTFAKTGTPKISKLAPAWLPVTPGDSALNYLEISSPSSFQMKNSTNFGNRMFWDSLGFNEDQNYKKIVE